MKKFVVIIAILAVVISIGISITFPLEPKKEKLTVFHATFADPKLYVNGIFTDTINIPKGEYQFNFVPNGDSPQILSISLKGPGFSFSEDYQLKGTEHQTGISSYYTWDYNGKKEIQIDNEQELQIKIDPHDNLLGTVSVDLDRK